MTSRLRSTGALSAFAAVALVVLTSGSAARGVAAQSAPVAPRSAAVPLPDDVALAAGALGTTPSARVTRARVDVQVPGSLAVLYLDPQSTNPDWPIVPPLAPAPRYLQPAHPLAQCRYVFQTIDATLYPITIRQSSYRKPGVVTSVGNFGVTTVSLLAFGSIPATATLHLSLPHRGRRQLPIVIRGYTTGQSLAKNDPAGSRGATGCDPGWEAATQFSSALTVASGQVLASLSDIRVDGHTTHVSASCRPVRPLQLHLNGEADAAGPYFPGGNGTLVQRLDTSTNTVGRYTFPTHPESQNLVIPPFTGCISTQTGEDVSKLVTALVSGDDNTLAVSQTPEIGSDISNANPSVCYPTKQPAGIPQCATIPQAVLPPAPGRPQH